MASGGYNSSEVDIHGNLITDEDMDVTTADYQLWSKLWILGTTYTDKSQEHTITLVLQNGSLIITGWMTGFSADRDAPEGIITIPITISFFIKSVDFSGIV